MEGRNLRSRAPDPTWVASSGVGRRLDRLVGEECWEVVRVVLRVRDRRCRAGGVIARGGLTVVGHWQSSDRPERGMRRMSQQTIKQQTIKQRAPRKAHGAVARQRKERGSRSGGYRTWRCRS
jgi:hypothetical protein